MAAKKKEELQEEKKLSVEEAFAAIEDKIEALDSEDISLEDSFKEYQEEYPPQNCPCPEDKRQGNK